MKKGERRPNRVEILPTHSVVYIRSRGTEFPCLVDTEDFPKVTKFTWSLGSYGYAVCHENHAQMHRFIMNAPAEMQVDHIHHNRLDNRKSELRVATRSMNQHNRERTPSNVYFHPQTGMWRVRMMVRRKVLSMGLYKSREEAAAVAAAARKRLTS